MTPASIAPKEPPATSLTLRDLLAYVEQVLARGIPGAVWVRAEIAAITDRRHLYLELIQHEGGREMAKCRATLWATERYALEGRFKRATGGGLKAGMQVLLFVTAEFHPQYGFALNIVDAAPEFTVGEAALRLDKLRRDLDAEGLLTRNRLLPVPQDFSRVIVISPRGAAGLGDFRRELDGLAAAGLLDVVYLEATFQGREAEASLLRALAQAAELHAQQGADALFIIRGGGATTDLAWLNSEAVARAAAQFPAPVITGIGHARDETILDELACVRTDTPSKAAAYLVGRLVERLQDTAALYAQIVDGVRGVVQEARRGSQAQYDRVQRAAQGRLERERQELDHLMRQVLGLSPRRTLERGYVLARRQDGAVVTHAAQLRAGERLRLDFQDGEVEVQVQDVGVTLSP